MVEYLYDLLAGNRLLDVTVHGAERALLRGVILTAQLSDGQSAEQEHGDKCHRHKRQDPARRDHEDERSDQRNEAGNQLRKGVVDHDIDVIDIVRETGHDLTGLPRIEEPYGQTLELREQIVTDPLDHAL